VFRVNYEPYSLLISTTRRSFDERRRSDFESLDRLGNQQLRMQAQLLDVHEDGEEHSSLFTLAVFHEQQEKPLLLLIRPYEFGPGMWLYPGALLVPETGLLLVGVGEQVFGYRLDPPAKLWQEAAEEGFWKWQRYQDVCLMTAELELAAWDVQGNRLWSIFVEPPWTYRLHDRTIEVEVMGVKTSFPLEGPPAVHWWR